MDLTLDFVVAQGITFLLYVSALAGIVQTVINTLKPQFITPIKERLEAEGRGDWYLFVFYLFRIAVTAIGFFTVWGGVEAVRELMPALEFLPDIGLGLGVIILTVLGQEVIHPLLDRLYILRDAASLLDFDVVLEDPDPNEPPEPVVTSSGYAPRVSSGEPLG